EKVVLGALMLEKDAFASIGDILHTESFYDKKHELIFEAILDLANKKEVQIDLLTVTEQLKKNGNLEAAGGVVYVSELTANVTSTVHLDFHAKIIAQKYLARELIRFAGLVQGKAYDETEDIEDLMQEAEGKLFEISQKNIKKDAVRINSILSGAKDAIVAAGKTKDGLSGIPSGFYSLDKITSGWQRSDLIIIAARPAMGKTAFVLSMAKNMAVDAHIPVAIFSLEMSNLQLANRLISNVCSIPGEKLKSGKLDNADWEQFDRKISELYDAPVYVDDTSGLSVFEVRTKARRLVRENGVKCIIIDYLQLMNASGMQYGSREQEVSIISRSLKGLAKELDIPVIALSQMNRKNEDRAGKEGKRPQMSDLRESGAIEQDADMVCFIHRPEYYQIMEMNYGNQMIATNGMAEIIVAKHRNGAVGDVVLKFEKEYAKFDNSGITWNGGNSYVEMESKMNSTPEQSGGDFISSGSSGSRDTVPF
ncbi:MAG: replicative DNA helicase, partial [Tannerella sp.]|nr:replicative DNA helicase [Tannerella sp.]